MGFFQLPEIQPGITQAQIGEVILDRRVDILLPLDVISNGVVNQEGIAKIVDIPLYGRIADSLLLDSLEGS